MRHFALALLTLLASLGAPAQTASPPASIADAAWIAGYWQGEGFGGVIEDSWMPPAGGAMIGSFRLTKNGKPVFYELFAIEEHEGSLRFVVKHFNPDWVGWEEKDKYVAMRLARIEPGVLAFGGVVFRKEGEDGLAVELTIRHKDGTTKQEALR